MIYSGNMYFVSIMALEPLTILCVDDDPDVVNLTATFLKREEDAFSVITETSAHDGLTRLNGNLDCIVSDYQMPGMDGLEFLRTVREDYPDLPFILFTGQGSEEVAADAIEAGVTSYYRKENGTTQYTVLANTIQNHVEQYRTEQYARSLEREYELVADTATDVFWTVDLTTERLSLSEGIAHFGYDADDLSPDFRWFFERVHPDDCDRMRQYYDDLIAREEAVFDELTAERGALSNEYRFRRADGTYAHCHGRGILLFEDGTPVKMVGTMTDVSERKEYERELERKTERLEAFSVAFPDIAFLLDEDGRYLSILAGSEGDDLLYMDAAELLGSLLHDVFPDKQADQFLSLIQTTLDSDEEQTVEYKLDVPAGERWFEGRVAPLPAEFDGTQAVVWVSRDITERKEQEQQLRQERALTEAIFNALPDAFVAFDEHGQLLRWSDSVPRITGYSDTELEEMQPTELFTESNVEQISDAVGSILAGRGPVTVEAEVITKKREEIPHEFTGAQLSDDAGTTLGLVASGRDITERKQRERELEQQNERLERFVDTVSHDLRNPLNGATGWLKLAQEDCDSEYLDDVERAHTRMETLIDDLLTLARESESVTEMGPAALADVVEGCWRNVETAEATLVTEAEQTIRANRGRLQQLLENLMRNAIEHGGGEVTVTVGDLNDGFYIQDDGSGIPEERRDQVFESGYSTLQDGTGFGLSIVKQIAEAHDWGVNVTEGDDGGARFEITGVVSA